MRILLVEDDRELAGYVRKGLEEEGYLVQASSPEDVVRGLNAKWEELASASRLPNGLPSTPNLVHMLSCFFNGYHPGRLRRLKECQPRLSTGWSRFLAWGMDAKMTFDFAASPGLGIDGMARSVLFFSVIFLISVSLALLYIFGFPRLFFAVLCLTTLFIVYLLFHPRNQWLIANRSRVDGARCVALTFDDGPDPVYTPKLLDLLREKDVKATFFVIGKRADQYPEIVRRAWAEGHLIGNHTWSHYPLFCFLLPRRLRAEIERGTESVRRSCGVRTRFFRSPVGLRHPLLAPYLENAGLEYISWTIRTLDTFTANSNVLARRILSRAASGDIILLHDHLPHGTDSMLQALPRVIDELRARGFEFVLAGAREDAGGTLEPTTCEPAP